MSVDGVQVDPATVAGWWDLVASCELDLRQPLLCRDLQQVASKDNFIFQIHELPVQQILILRKSRLLNVIFLYEGLTGLRVMHQLDLQIFVKPSQSSAQIFQLSTLGRVK